MVSLLLTEETLKDISKVLAASDTLKRDQRLYEREASIGRTFMKNAQVQIDDPETPDDYRGEQRQKLQQRQSDIEENIDQAQKMKKELGLRKCNLEYSRAQLDRVFRDVLTEVGLVDNPDSEKLAVQQHTPIESEISAVRGPPISNSEDLGFQHQESIQHQDSFESQPSNERVSLPATPTLNFNDGKSTNESTNNRDDCADQDARTRLDTATERVSEAREAFNQRESEYLNDIREYEQVCSRTKINVFHVQRGADLTRAFADAEEEWEEAQAQATGLRLLANHIEQEFGFVDEDGDGYRESQDPIFNANGVDRKSTESWAAEVAKCRDVAEEQIRRAEEWDAESVNISDAGSAVNTAPEWRRAIDCWQTQQAELRTRFKGLQHQLD